ncbi:MAG: GerMN domain-containing protein [Eubacteriales bacterium]|nr:GerMN domain-containing protein [Eubacteriales bacterium]
MKKKERTLLLVLFLICALTGCGRKTGDTAGYQVYFSNSEASKLVSHTHVSQKTEPTAVLEELFAQMRLPYAAEEEKSLLPEKVEIDKFDLMDGQLTITFNDEYRNMDNVSEILLRAGIVMMATQVNDVRTVVFHIGDSVLKDSSGEPVGAMTSNMFINNPVGINSYQYASLTLYFSNKAGDKIVREMRNVHYSSNTTLEKVLMEQLQKGPMNERLRPVLSSNVRVLDVKVDKKTCIVNLSKEFLEQKPETSMSPEVEVFSIVNSLCDMLNVDRVQFQIEGNSDVLFRDELSFNGPFHRNSELIETVDSSSEEPDEIIAEPSIGL